MDKITIEDLEVRFHVGVPDEERVSAQRLLITVVMAGDFSEAARKDDLTRTINYFEVTRRIQSLGNGRQWKLIETLAVEIAETVLKEFGPDSVSVTVKKFIMPETRWIAVETVRSR